MTTITISKKEYEKLVDNATRYEYLKQALKTDIFSKPPISSRENVLVSFEATKKYSKVFLASLARGLKRSSYFSL